MGLSMGFRASVSLRPAIQATGPLALAPVGLPPTEHVCLSGRTPLLPAALTASSSCGAVYATTSNERPAASSYLRSPKETGGSHRWPEAVHQFAGPKTLRPSDLAVGPLRARPS